jgi:adenylate kinase
VSRNLIIFGPPGAGKGTQAPRLAAQFAIPHIATGDMLRANLRDATTLGIEAKRFMNAGELVPDEVVIAMLIGRIGQPDATAGFLLDGFPRTVPQAEALDVALAHHTQQIDALLVLDVDEQEIVRRISGRLVCANGHPCPETAPPPPPATDCDTCGAPLSRRPDDEPDVVRTRYRSVYLAQTLPVRDHYRRVGVAEIVVDGTGSPDEVYERLADAVASLG